MDLSRFDSGLDRRLSTIEETRLWDTNMVKTLKREAVRLALSSGLTRRKVAADYEGGVR